MDPPKSLRDFGEISPISVFGKNRNWWRWRGIEPRVPEYHDKSLYMFILIFNFPSRTSIGGISEGYPLRDSSGAPKEKRAVISRCLRQVRPRGMNRLTGYLIKVTLPVEPVPAPLAWWPEADLPLLALLDCQHLIFCQVFKEAS